MTVATHPSCKNNEQGKEFLPMANNSGLQADLKIVAEACLLYTSDAADE